MGGKGLLGAIIGGTGVYSMSDEQRLETVKTPYGNIDVHFSRINGQDIVFLARHGSNHASPPHKVNYRANMWALHSLGVSHIFATCAVGSNNLDFHPGDVVVLKDFIDFTHQRPVTFYDNEAVHVSMADPYCRHLRSLFLNTVSEKGFKIAGEAVYVCTEGPRFETAAEIRMFQKLGGDVVGMTNVPEVTLAKELKMCYSAVGIVTNWCTGFGEEVDKETLLSMVENNKNELTKMFVQVLSTKGLSKEYCQCQNAIIRL